MFFRVVTIWFFMALFAVPHSYCLDTNVNYDSKADITLSAADSNSATKGKKEKKKKVVLIVVLLSAAISVGILLPLIFAPEPFPTP